MTELEVKTRYQIVNNKSCKEYYLEVPIEDVDIIKDGYLERPSDVEEAKYFEYIISNIPDTEKVILKDSRTVWEEYAFFEVYTKSKISLELEKRIWKVLEDESKGHKKWKLSKEYSIDVSDDMVCKLELFRVNYDRETLEEIKSLLDAEDYEVCFDGHMEMDFLLYKLRDPHNETHYQRVQRLCHKYKMIDETRTRLGLIGVSADSDIFAYLQELYNITFKKYSDAYEAYQKIYTCLEE